MSSIYSVLWYKLTLTIALCFWTTTLSVQAQTETGFLKRSIELGSERYSYQIYLPPNWNPERTWPVILFLHGAGERGSDGVAQTTVGFPPSLNGLQNFPSIVVMPQCRRRAWWWDADMEAQVFKILESSIQEYRGDPDRVYLTGLSMGGYATWAFSYKYSGRFAALVPVCGGIRPRRRLKPPNWHPAASTTVDPYLMTAERIGQIPVWIFHGSADPVVPTSESRMMFEALKKSGGNVKYTEYEDVGHNSWDRAYGEGKLLPWLLSQKRSTKRRQ